MCKMTDFCQLDTNFSTHPISVLPNLMPFDLALFPYRDIAAILLEHEKWEEMLRSSDEESTTPMRALITFMPGKLHHC